MESRVTQALEKHRKGYNCCQAVFCNYADLLAIDESIAFRVAEGFGFGYGGAREVCGAVSGMTLLAGWKNSSGGVENGLSKKETYKLVKAMMSAFEEKNQSVLCRELLGEAGKPKLRSCDGCIEDACLIVEDTFFNS